MGVAALGCGRISRVNHPLSWSQKHTIGQWKNQRDGEKGGFGTVIPSNITADNQKGGDGFFLTEPVCRNAESVVCSFLKFQAFPASLFITKY